ncbi:hypothetical protein GE061_017823 [Apolygus lucorum]|uniref:UDP-glucuronosyltransferase n=1 Tax=Apolygus lucorum TaxID=248454 RepID=A0A8S9XDD5_APOLU|nr:hypothetical protein GE061_017823 [Apolygus lucorum]
MRSQDVSFTVTPTSRAMIHWMLLACLTGEALAANILGIFPFTAKSHFTMYEVLLEELHARNHNLTVMSHFPLKSPKPNYTDVSLVGSVPSLHGNLSMSHLNDAPLNLRDNLRQIHQNFDIFDSMLRSREVQRLLNSTSKFDLLIIELFDTDVFLAFAHRFRAPYISISPCPLLPWAHGRVGNEANPAFVPVFFSEFNNNMDIVSRAMNALYYAASNFYYDQIMDAESEKLMKRLFPGYPPLRSIAEDVSLILVNTHGSLHRPPPSSQRVVQVGGMHVRDPQPLKDAILVEFLETAEEGVILFSMGSMFKFDSLPRDKREAFDKALKRVSQRVIWKWESGKAINGNILYMDWVPQRDVLAHRNVVLFIYHGGLLGVTEAVHSGVPILGIPMFGDMTINMAAVASAGAGISLRFRDITDDLLYNTIKHMLESPKYKRNAVELAKLYNDRPMPPLQTAVYWTEYVLRNKGAPNLKPHSLSWYQLWLLDLIILSTFVVIVLAVITVAVTKRLARSSAWILNFKTKEQ